jgi:hypothetical protein
MAKDMMVLTGSGWQVEPKQSERIRVDDEEIGFYDGREFRTFREFWAGALPSSTAIAAGATYVIRAIVPIDIVLFSLQLGFDNGQIRVETVVGGTPGGAFADVLPIFGANNMAVQRALVTGGGYYLPTVTLAGGGTHTGGTVLDVIRLKIENSTGAAASVGNSPDDERGVAANTYYFRITNIGAGVAEGTFKARWEEKP